MKDKKFEALDRVVYYVSVTFALAIFLVAAYVITLAFRFNIHGSGLVDYFYMSLSIGGLYFIFMLITDKIKMSILYLITATALPFVLILAGGTFGKVILTTLAILFSVLFVFRNTIGLAPPPDQRKLDGSVGFVEEVNETLDKSVIVKIVYDAVLGGLAVIGLFFLVYVYDNYPVFIIPLILAVVSKITELFAKTPFVKDTANVLYRIFTVVFILCIIFLIITFTFFSFYDIQFLESVRYRA